MICKKCNRPTRSPYVYGACACLTPDLRDEPKTPPPPECCGVPMTVALPGKVRLPHGEGRPVWNTIDGAVRCMACGTWAHSGGETWYFTLPRPAAAYEAEYQRRRAEQVSAPPAWAPGDPTGVACPCGGMPRVVWGRDDEYFARARCDCGAWSHFVLDAERFSGMQHWHATPGANGILSGPRDRLEARYQREQAGGEIVYLKPPPMPKWIVDDAAEYVHRAESVMGLNAAVPTPAPPPYRAARVRFPEGVTPGDAAKAVREFLEGMGVPVERIDRVRPGWPDGWVEAQPSECGCGLHALVDVYGHLPWLPHDPGDVFKPMDFPAFRRLVPQPRPRHPAAGNPMGWGGMGRWLP